MAVNRFVLNNISYHGAGAIGEIPGEITRRGFAKAFVCSDPDLVRFGVTGKVTAKLDEAGIPWELYDQIKPNPTIKNVQDGVAAFKASGADMIVAVGGGSAMDTAKGIGIIAENPEFADVVSLEGVAPTKNHATFTIAVPTTAGTAAEVTINYVITDPEKVRKFVCVDVNDIPDVAVVDPDMMASMPAGLTAATGMDALTHAVEAYIGRSTTKQTRELALDATKLIFGNIQRAYEHGDDHKARENMLHAAYKAGIAFSMSYVGYVHAIAHSLGGQYGVPHGLANAVILPYVLEAYGEAAHKKLHQLGMAAGVCDATDSDAEGAAKFIAAIKELNASMNIPEKISGIKRDDIAHLAHTAEREANPLYPVPKLMTEHELAALYEEIADWNE